MNKESASLNPRKKNPLKHAHHFAIIGVGGRLKTTTRHMAALDFLSSITMVNEAQIKQEGLNAIARVNEAGRESKNAAFDLSSVLPINADKPPDGPGRMLPGFYAPTLTIPPELRYKMKLYEQRNELKRWEDQVLAGTSQSAVGGTSHPPVLSSRMFFSRSRAYPLVVSSVIRYDAGEEKARLETLRSGDTKGFEVFQVAVRDWRGSSYQSKLTSTYSDETAGDEFNIFDDSELRYGSGHRHTVRGGVHTGPVISSIILYANEKDLRESVNEQFIDKYPHLPPSLNISEIRDLTISLAKGCTQLNIELSTAALGYILFERLCQQGIITKTNRNITMAVSLLLAFKFNECFLMETQTVNLHRLFEFMDREWDVSKKEVMQAEFGAYLLLNFSLHAPKSQIVSIYQRLLKYLRLSSSRYLAGYNSNY